MYKTFETLIIVTIIFQMRIAYSYYKCARYIQCRCGNSEFSKQLQLKLLIVLIGVVSALFIPYHFSKYVLLLLFCSKHDLCIQFYNFTNTVGLFYCSPILELLMRSIFIAKRKSLPFVITSQEWSAYSNLAVVNYSSFDERHTKLFRRSISDCKTPKRYRT